VDLMLVILLLVLGGGVYYTSRPTYAGPELRIILFVLAFLVLIVMVFRAFGLV
jgi:hypothetical protein